MCIYLLFMKMHMPIMVIVVIMLSLRFVVKINLCLFLLTTLNSLNSCRQTFVWLDALICVSLLLQCNLFDQLIVF